MEIDDLIDELIDNTKKSVKLIEKRIYETVLEHFNDGLVITNNKVKIGGNEKVLESLWKVISKKLERDLAGFGKYILAGISNIFDLGVDEAKVFDPRAEEISPDIKDALMDSAKKAITAQTDLSLVYTQIKAKAVGLMSKYDGVSLRELREALEKQIVKDGAVSKYWDRWTQDIYAQYQRAGANNLRKELGLKHCLYEGGLIESSRPFCEEKNGNVFTEDEVKAWAKEEWDGKNAGYVPETDCGGYNCRHRLRWISAELAKQLRPDLR